MDASTRVSLKEFEYIISLGNDIFLSKIGTRK